MDTYKKILSQKLHRISAYHFLYDYQSRKYKKYNTIFNYFKIITIGSSASITTTISKDFSPDFLKVLSIITPIVLYIGTLMTGLQQMYNYEAQSEKNRATSMKYFHLHNVIKNYIDLEIHSKTEEELKDFCKDINNQIDDISISAPDVDNDSLKKLQQNFTLLEEPTEVLTTEIPELTPAQQYQFSRWMANVY